MEYKKKFEEWELKVTDAHVSQELDSIKDKDDEINERFYQNLSFGTGGIRGILGAGPNRMNIYTIRRATQGLAEFLNDSRTVESSSVAIAYDSRHYSDIFAEEAALVLAANGIKVYLFDSLRPTPELSFAVRHLNCKAGIVITASHNPAEYNGYKVYGPDGGQITLETANAITSKISNLDFFDDISTDTAEAAIEQGLLVFIGEEVDQAYLEKVTQLSINPEVLKGNESFKTVYTPLHGTGLNPICKSLDMLGYKNYHVVNSQKHPDGNFPTVKSPNPEEREALKEGIDLAREISADIVLGTDPDTDRVGVAVKEQNGSFSLLTGNQIGALLTYYLVSSKKDISARDAVIKTIVTSELGADIARSQGASVFETLTGFKFIGEKIKEFEQNSDHQFLFGYEESYGYLAGTFVRDKDGVSSSVLIIEMAAYYKSNGLSLIDVLDSIYKQFGYYTDKLKSYKFEGRKGKQHIKFLMDEFLDTEELISKFPDLYSIENYKTGKRSFMHTPEVEQIDLPKENVIKIQFEDNSWFAVRPSGTEPKLKLYFSTIASSREKSSERMEMLEKQVSSFIENRSD